MERFIPGTEGEIWYEHWHRYHFVAPRVSGLKVLDIACGEGYGAALLANRAAHVIGVDVQAEVVAQARKRYGAIANLDFREGRCEAIPLPDASIDVVVSLETLEHIAEPERLLDEAARVLGPDGILIVSTPNKAVYSDERDYRNPFHVRELYADEFDAMLRKRFPAVRLFGQRVDAYSAIWPIGSEAAQCQLLDARNKEAHQPGNGIAEPMYFIATCARHAARLEEAAGAFSLLSDRDHYIFRDYAEVQQRLGELRARLERLEAAYVSCQQQIAELTSAGAKWRLR